MKKLLLTSLVCGVILFGLTGCGRNKNRFHIGQKSNIEIIEKDVSLSVKEKTSTKTGITLIIKNNSNSEVIYGEPYELEIKKDGEWYKVNV